ncbi:RHTO0S12e01288g1_1 [Rhodotorula toruloides]|uniref:carbonic anhydrase n=1 Tax=Rhodotorula toruloides TaxID=5286 RepID=A0A061B8C8_RHOTO|nr:RHTO0S12e01288g1_1 [Rhodotorula toruloides]
MPRSTAHESASVGGAKPANPLPPSRASSSPTAPLEVPAAHTYDASGHGDSSSELSDDSEDDLVNKEAGEGDKHSRLQGASTGRRQKGEQIMRSVGKGLLNKVTLHGLHSDEASADAEKAHLTDLEAQAATHRRKRGSWWTPLPTAHKVLIVCSIALCIILATIGIVVGVVVARHTAERSEVEKADPGSRLKADEQWIATQGSQAQDELAVDDTHGIASGNAAPGASHYVGEPLQPLALPVGTSDAKASTSQPPALYSRFPELQALLNNNHDWQGNVTKAAPQFLPTLAQGQHPKFAYLGCADSRVPESVLAQKPGEIFVTRNVGNEYLVDDLSSETVMSYAISHLGVRHIIVMGHTKCGAVRAAIASPSKEVITNMDETRIDQWIRPIRSLFATTNRTEVVSFREAHHNAETLEADDVTDEVWRAMVEENVKINVQRLAQDSSVQHAWYLYRQQMSTQAAEQPAVPTRRSEDKKQAELWIHGWIYDVETGLVEDLGVSVGPDGSLVQR